MADLTRLARVSGSATNLEKRVEPSFQPPMASKVFKFLLWALRPLNLA